MAASENVLLQAGFDGGRRALSFVYRNFVRGKTLQDFKSFLEYITRSGTGATTGREHQRAAQTALLRQHLSRFTVRARMDVRELLRALAVSFGGRIAEIIWEVMVTSGAVERVRQTIMLCDPYAATAVVVFVGVVGILIRLRRTELEADVEIVVDLRVVTRADLDPVPGDLQAVCSAVPVPPRIMRQGRRGMDGVEFIFEERCLRVVTRSDLDQIPGDLEPVCPGPMLLPPGWML